MQPVDEVGVAIAAVYAKAIMALAGVDSSQELVLGELEGLVELANTNPDFEQFLTSSVIDSDARRDSLEKSLRGKVSDTVLDAVQVLNRKARLSLLEAVAGRCRLLFEALRNEVEVTVTTAVALGEGARSSLLSALKSHTGSDAILTERVDASLVGGMVVRIGDEKIDFSVSTKLRRFREALLSRASHEIHGGREYFQDV